LSFHLSRRAEKRPQQRWTLGCRTWRWPGKWRQKRSCRSTAKPDVLSVPGRNCFCFSMI